MMKKLISIFTFSLLLSACGKEFLNKEPIIGTTESNFYNTAEDAVAAVNAAYATLQFEMTPAGHFRWFWGDIMSDDSKKGGSGDNDVLVLKQLEEFQGPVNSDLLEAEWDADYEGIYRANIALENIPDIEMDGDLKARLIAEVTFIRAWYHYLLGTMFGNVPLIDHVLAPSEYNMGQSSPDAVLDFVENELKAAIPNLPLRSGYGADDLGRISKGTAQGLLLKTYLWRQKYDMAESIAAEIIQSGEYFLDPEYSNIWTVAGENGLGSVFEIQYMTESGGNWGRNNANEGTFTNVFTRARGQFEGFGFNIPTQDFVDEFIENGVEDPRLGATVFRVGEQMGDRGLFTKDATGYPHDYYTRKTFSNLADQANLGDPVPNGGTNDRVIRYADILLMHAEAAAQNGNANAAHTSLNEVRSRVGLPAITSTGDELLQAIYKERRLELGLEGHRFFDLVRTERAQEVLGTLGYKHETHKLFPIPLSQIQASNGTLNQNPGY